jgi:hypothetical protein
MSAGLRQPYVPETDPLSRSVNALRSSLAQMKAILDSGVTDTVDIVTEVGATTYTYRQLTIEDGVITAIGDEQTGSI